MYSHKSVYVTQVFNVHNYIIDWVVKKTRLGSTCAEKMIQIFHCMTHLQTLIVYFACCIFLCLYAVNQHLFAATLFHD